MTPDAIREFQKGRYDWLGAPLKVDGDMGPRTRWALAVGGLDPRRQAIVGRACAFVGHTERATNRGPDIDAWLQRCDAQLGSAWCAAFASWCLSVRDMPIVRQAGAQALGKCLPATIEPVAGDVMWFPTGSWTGHCGIVVGLGLDVVATVEGNHDNAVRIVLRQRTRVNFASALDDSPAALVPVPPGLTLVPVRLEGTR